MFHHCYPQTPKAPFDPYKAPKLIGDPKLQKRFEGAQMNHNSLLFAEEQDKIFIENNKLYYEAYLNKQSAIFRGTWCIW